MTPLGTALVELYARHLEHGPESTDEYRALRGDGEPSTEFLETRYPIAARREAVWRLRAKPGHEQVRHALLSVRQASNEVQRELVFEFTRAALSSVWTDAQRACCDGLGSVFVHGHDYFLSFTGRGPASDQAVLRVNREFRGFIDETLLSTLIESSNLGTQNLLAHALNARLNEYERRGFFYPEKFGDWQQVKNKLEQACRRSLSLIQLVDNEMLREREHADVNYCHHEYLWATDVNTCMLFLLPYAKRTDLLSPDEVAPGFDVWYGAIATVDVPILRPARVGDIAALQDIARVIDALVHRIRETRLSRLGDIPV